MDGGLGPGAQHLGHVREPAKLTHNRLGDAPGVLEALGQAGVKGEGVAAAFHTAQGVPDEDALGAAGAQEDGVEG